MAKRFNLADYVKAEGVSESNTAEVTMIRTELIRDNPRNFYATDSVADLVDSIALNGLMDPLVVYPGGGILYTLLSGHRRFRAIRALRCRDGHEHDFDEIPCIVRPAPKNTAMEDILLIQANSTGRVRTPADMATEAERLTAALIELKKQGADLPGRLRDIVADAMGVSSSKLGRLRVIENHLKVPGFAAAFKDRKLSEEAAYQIAQMNPDDQYKLLDHAIDAGLDYERMDIKSVQRLKRVVESGESPRQDLAVAAEKRGIYCPEGDFSPLFSALVRDALPADLQRRVRRCATKAAGVQLLHDFGLAHASYWGGGVDFDSDPQALRLQSPVCWRIKWAEVWELLMLPGGAGESDPVPAEPAHDPVPPPAAPAPEPGPGWRRCATDPPPAGQTVCVVEVNRNGTYYADIYVFRDAEYYSGGDYDEAEAIRKDAWWFPIPPVSKEMGQ